jgi:ATP-dependent RNA helicase DOB1
MEMEGERDAMEVEQESVIAEYHDLKEKITVYEQDMKDVMNLPNYCVPFMHSGRLIRIRNGKTLFDWGVIINHNPRLKPIVPSSL